jgi:hypothetical protein
MAVLPACDFSNVDPLQAAWRGVRAAKTWFDQNVADCLMEVRRSTQGQATCPKDATPLMAEIALTRPERRCRDYLIASRFQI